MKALTLTQPWASLIALRKKRFETRSWGTAYRGKLAIHAAKGFPKHCQDFAARCRETGIALRDPLPLGEVICTVELVDVWTVIEQMQGGVKLELTDGCRLQLGGQELAFGDYRDGRKIWELRDLVVLPIPIQAKGALSLWEWEP